MRNFKKIIIISVFSLSLGTGTTAAQWLELETGIRAVGMGGTQVASGRDISSSLYNPVNISYIEGQEAFFNKTNYIVDISHSFLGYAKQMSDLDIVGVNIFFLDSGWIPETTDEANTGNDIGSLGNFKVYNFLVQGSYSRILNDRLRVGAGFKYFREDIDNMYMQGMALDIGCHYDLPFGIKFGASINNIGPDVRFEGDGLQQYVDSDVSPSTTLVTSTGSFPIPRVIRLGVESKVMGSERNSFIRNQNIGLSLSVDVIKPLDYDLHASVGLEASLWEDRIYIRGGSRLGHDTAGLGLGLGLKFNGIKIDYSISDYGDLGSTGQFGIGLRF